MGGKGNTVGVAVLDLELGGQTYSPPATLYCALFTSAPTDGGGGVEVSGGGYARVPVTNNLTNFPAATVQNGVPTKKNGTAIDFGTASGNWGTVVAAAFYDAPSGGNLRYWGPLSANKTVNSGDTFKINANNATFTEA